MTEMQEGYSYCLKYIYWKLQEGKSPEEAILLASKGYEVEKKLRRILKKRR